VDGGAARSPGAALDKRDARAQFTVSLVLDSADRGINVGDRA